MQFVFSSFPDCQVIDENYTLMPQKADAVIEKSDNFVTLTCGKLKVKLEPNGKQTFYKGTYEISARIDEFIAFVKSGSDVIECFA